MGNNKNKDKKDNNSNTFRGIAKFSHIGVTMAASILIGVFLGRYLDERFGTNPWLLLVFSLLGVGGAFIRLFNLPNDKD